MKRIGLHIHFYCNLLVMLTALVFANITPTETRGFYLMVVLTVFALIQGKLRDTVVMWLCFLLTVGLLFLYRYYSWSDTIISRYTFVVMRNTMPTFFALFIFATTPVSEITAGFDSLHFPKKTGIAVVTLFRYFPSLGHDVKTAYQNMKLRGLGGIRNLILHPLRTVKCFVLPLIVHLYATVEELAVSATARGAESICKRYSLYEKKFSVIDGIVLVIILVGLGGVFFL